jgi:TM2 domain-containing membrane protein YozV
LNLELFILAILLIAVTFIFLVFVIYLPLKWVRKVAKRNGRSVSGFCWLFLIAPLIAWPILLTIDKREEHSTPA